jgi:hypothetical protein
LKLTELQQKLRATLSLHVGDEMAQYILAKAAQGGRSFPIFATDARTGQPLRPTFDPGILTDTQLPLF